MTITRFRHVDTVCFDKGLINIACYPEHCRTEIWRENYFLDKNHEFIMHLSSTDCMWAKQLSSKNDRILVREDYGDNKNITIIQVFDKRPRIF